MPLDKPWEYTERSLLRLCSPLIFPDRISSNLKPKTETSHGISAPLSLSLGHLRLSVTDLPGAIAFFEALGARQDVDRDNFAVMEFSDKTRLQLTGGASNIATDAPLQFDFRVKDIDSAWQECADNGLKPAPIARQTPGHDSFIVNGPDGCEIKINSGYKRA